MSLINIVRQSEIERTARVQQIEGIFEMSAENISKEEWEVDLPLDEQEWNIGLIVGASGSGKSTIAAEVFGDKLRRSYEWQKNKALVDSFPEHLSIKDISYALSSVGFSSPPNWLRPYDVLSTGEKFRADMARALMDDDLVVMDEFTSVVDRVVAQIGSNAMAKAIRRKNRQFVGVSCHYDIIEWLQPDWTYEPAENRFTWRSLRQRPQVNITLRRVHRNLWKLFRKHHYLNHDLNISSKCFVGFLDDTPVAFEAIISQPHPISSGWRVHRSVCLPDYQGLGISGKLEDKVASIMRATGKPVFTRTSHPAVIRAKAKSTNWKMTGKPKRQEHSKTADPAMMKSHATNRFTAGFKYVGAIDYESAKTLEII